MRGGQLTKNAFSYKGIIPVCLSVPTFFNSCVILLSLGGLIFDHRVSQCICFMFAVKDFQTQSLATFTLMHSNTPLKMLSPLHVSCKLACIIAFFLVMMHSFLWWMIAWILLQMLLCFTVFSRWWMLCNCVCVCLFIFFLCIEVLYSKI